MLTSCSSWVTPDTVEVAVVLWLGRLVTPPSCRDRAIALCKSSSLLFSSVRSTTLGLWGLELGGTMLVVGRVEEGEGRMATV